MPHVMFRGPLRVSPKLTSHIPTSRTMQSPLLFHVPFTCPSDSPSLGKYHSTYTRPVESLHKRDCLFPNIVPIYSLCEPHIIPTQRPYNHREPYGLGLLVVVVVEVKNDGAYLLPVGLGFRLRVDVQQLVVSKLGRSKKALMRAPRRTRIRTSAAKKVLKIPCG